MCSTAYSSSRGFLPILWVFSLRQTNGPHVNINLYHPNGHICLVPIHLSLPFFTSPSRVPIPCQPCLPASAALTLPTSIPCGNNSTSFTPIKHPTGFAIFNHCHHTRRGSPSQPYIHVTLAFIQYPRSSRPLHSPSLCIITTSTSHDTPSSTVPYIPSPSMVTSATFHVHSLLAPPPIGGGGAPLLELALHNHTREPLEASECRLSEVVVCIVGEYV